MRNAQVIFKNFFSLTSASIAARFIGIITVIYLAKVLGPSDFGNINFAMALISYFAMLAHFGLDAVGVRKITQEEGKHDIINDILSFKMLFGLLSLALLAVATSIIGKPQVIKWLILFYGITIFTSNIISFNWVLQAIEKMEHTAVSYIIQGISYLLLIVLFVNSGSRLLLIPWILLAAQALSALYLFFKYKKFFPEYRFRFGLSNFKPLFRETLPLAMSGFAGIVILNGSITLLGFMKPAHDVGFFSAVQKISQVFLDVVNAYLGAVFPAVSKYMVKSPETMRKIINYTLKILKISAIPAAAGIILLSNEIILLLFGPDFIQSSLALKIIIFHPALTLGVCLLFYVLIAARRQKDAFAISFTHALLTAGLAVPLIHKFSVAGAAAANTAAASISLALYHVFTRKLTKAKLLDAVFFKACLAAGVMVYFVNLMKGMNLFFIIIAGALVYSAAALLLKIAGKDDFLFIKTLISILQNRS